MGGIFKAGIFKAGIFKVGILFQGKGWVGNNFVEVSSILLKIKVDKKLEWGKWEGDTFWSGIQVKYVDRSLN